MDQVNQARGQRDKMLRLPEKPGQARIGEDLGFLALFFMLSMYKNTC